jgi:hypothetical protein
LGCVVSGLGCESGHCWAWAVVGVVDGWALWTEVWTEETESLTGGRGLSSEPLRPKL